VTRPGTTSTPDAADGIRLGLRANLAQFVLLAIVNVFVGGMVGLERTVTPLVGAREFHSDEAGPAGWQAWAEPEVGAPFLWAVSFGAGVPHDLVAAFAAALSSTAPVLRRVLPESTRDRLLRVPAS
jgi:hypothetical protein